MSCAPYIYSTRKLVFENVVKEITRFTGKSSTTILRNSYADFGVNKVAKFILIILLTSSQMHLTVP